ncbi:torso-like protein isoform X2 [Odontomachus brunneus]|nr:torso-like protein isoform X2 [Odontomachus brunneus]XP_032687109.1 torso-like protein isoform X2 [Odontomachus brunneus]XP_032687110.1 torso-like protein isoform X2 [Odontomachus brunneus]XP_032687111.1 torso-like protein isoform X2 [Odontomachus brunneus]XP_032687112.1 torso-like protein isoform X2 [Odontomachus brunneus]XP_032687113.1 torso-like protein isoform X2 [Odontomachus brunneus]XP_032687114.1 torso-like protein isoform X2 [Odontomachus brunneus]XP_032687115.1 torso-like protei
MWSRTRLFLLTLTLVLLIGAQIRVSRSQRPRLGSAVNVFSRYGYLSISMRVVPRNDTETWVFREPMLDVFKNPTPMPIKQRSQGKAGTAVFVGDFHMEFCDNVRQLLQAYFRDFTFEKLERPWHAFTASWSKAAISKHLGINASFITGDHCYVLVRVARFRDNQRLAGTAETLALDDSVLQQTENITIGDTGSVVRFIRNFGSHYIASYITGNSLYQVFVYTPQVYSRIKERLKTRGVAELSSLELGNYFSPWYAEHMGSIQSASGNRSVETWAVQHLRVQHYIFTYASLLKLHGDTALLKQLDGLLDDEALLQLQLRTLAPAFKDAKRREWFLEVIDNYFKLWEVNM